MAVMPVLEANGDPPAGDAPSIAIAACDSEAVGCLSGLAVLLALAVPASIAPASLVGAYVVLALLAAAAVGVAMWNTRRRRAAALERQLPGRPRTFVWIGALTVAYAIAILVIHEAT